MRRCKRLIVAIFIVGNVFTSGNDRFIHAQTENPIANYIADSFYTEAEARGIPWEKDDGIRYAEGILDILEIYKESLGDENYRIIKGYLPTLVREMVNTVVWDTKPDPLFIDSFIADFEGRVKLLAERGGPIFPDENTRLIIKSQITEFIEVVTQDLQPTEEAPQERLDAMKRRLIETMYFFADHPLYSEFKRPMGSEENTNKQDIRNRVATINFNSLHTVRKSYETASQQSKRVMEYGILQAYTVNKITDHWLVEPRLQSSETAKSLFKQAVERRLTDTSSFE